MERLTRHIYPGLICGIIIMILCGLPGSYFPKVRTFWEWLGPDKILHSVMFVCFALSIMSGYRKEYCERGKAYRIKLQLITLLVSMSYAALTEILQRYVFIGRCGSIYDFFADVIGCVLGIFIFK
ncbi:MAG: VanZ family protein, partial [Bacteroidales bacterium]|nr:VanZ family protein [Bacteroidales bacterium]